MNEKQSGAGSSGGDPEKTRAKRLSEAAKRALAEAEERRRKSDTARDGKAGPKEVNGPKGPEPTRYGDWERKGILSDF